MFFGRKIKKKKKKVVATLLIDFSVRIIIDDNVYCDRERRSRVNVQRRKIFEKGVKGYYTRKA